MLDSITCDTDPGEIIKESDISGIISELNDIASVYSNEIKSTIAQEQSSGGLSAEAFYLNDKPLILDASNSLIDAITISEDTTNFVSQVESSLNRQRKAEINKLLEKIDEKLEELNNELSSLKSQLSSIPNVSSDSTLYSYYNSLRNNLEKDIRSLEKEIDKYEKKRAVVGGMS